VGDTRHRAPRAEDDPYQDDGERARALGLVRRAASDRSGAWRVYRPARWWSGPWRSAPLARLAPGLRRGCNRPAGFPRPRGGPLSLGRLARGILPETLPDVLAESGRHVRTDWRGTRQRPHLGRRRLQPMVGVAARPEPGRRQRGPGSGRLRPQPAPPTQSNRSLRRCAAASSAPSRGAIGHARRSILLSLGSEWFRPIVATGVLEASKARSELCPSGRSGPPGRLLQADVPRGAGQPRSGVFEGSKGRPEAAPSRSRASRPLASSTTVPS
jgi:hypothetical protein